jgi:hypothetical protein
MKTENFDETIRKKLVGIEEKFTEKDIDKVFNHVTRHSIPLPRKFNGSGLFYTIVVATVVGFVIYGVSLLIENKTNTKETSPKQTPVVFENDIKSDNSRLILLDSTSNSSVLKIETMLNEIAETTPSQQQVKMFTKDSEAISLAENSAEVKNAGAAIIFTATETSQLTQVKKEAIQPEIIQQMLSSEIDEDRAKSHIQNLVPDSIQIKNAEQLMDYQPVVIGEISEEKKEEKFKDSETKSDANKLGKSDLNPDSEQKSDIVKVNKSISFFDEVELASGFGTEIANGRGGIEIIGEVIMKKKLSFSSGIKFTKNFTESFSDEQDFYKHKSRHFDQDFHEHHDEREPASNITIDGFIWQIPLTINYNLRLKNGYSLVFGLGTDLDIYQSQDIHYENHQGNDSLTQPMNFKTSEPVTVFNNLTITVGAQKQWNRLILRAKPFINPQIIQVNYKSKDIYYGFGLQLLYTFKKD